MDDFYDPGDTRDQCEEIASELVSRSLTSKRNSSSYAQGRRVDWAEPHPCLQMAVDLVTSFLERNDYKPEGIAELVGSVHARLVELYYGASATVPGGMAQGLNDRPLVPAVPIKDSVTDDYVICLEDGRKLKTLRRHLMTRYRMTLDQYRHRWGLPRDYPVVAPSHSRMRAELARRNGLGRKPDNGRQRPFQEKNEDE